MKIKVILNKDIPRVGQRGDILEVTRVYADNVLLKGGNAVIATDKMIEQHKMKLELAKNKKQEINNEYNNIFKDLVKNGIKINRKADRNNHLYAKVKAQDLVDYIYDKYKISINNKQITLLSNTEEIINDIGITGEYKGIFDINNNKYKINLTIAM